MDFDVSITNDPDDITGVLDLIFNLIAGVIDAMQSINLFGGVSLFDFSVALTVMSIVITYLVNVAKHPNSESGKEVIKRKEHKYDNVSYEHKNP